MSMLVSYLTMTKLAGVGFHKAQGSSMPAGCREHRNNAVCSPPSSCQRSNSSCFICIGVIDSPSTINLILDSTRHLVQQRLVPFETPPPIYLFIYLLPMTVSGIKSWGENRTHFWSLDENGRSEMTDEECRRWGVPELNTHIERWGTDDVLRWPSRVYDAIRNWQVARGFDFTTADFAQSLGYPELEILIDNEAVESRFEEVHG